MEKNQVNVYVGEGKTNEIIIREGKALAPVEPSQYSVSGTIAAPQTYFGQREKVIDVLLAVVEVDKDAGWIRLKEDPRDPKAAVVTGQITRHPFFISLGVNTDKAWSAKALWDTLRFEAKYFGSPEQYKEFKKKLENIKVKVEHEIETQNERQGVIKNNKTSTAQTEFDGTSVQLKAPIFIGSPAETFEIQIQIEPDGSTFKMYLFCQELMEREEVQRTELILDGLVGLETLAIIYH